MITVKKMTISYTQNEMGKEPKCVNINKSTKHKKVSNKENEKQQKL